MYHPPPSQIEMWWAWAYHTYVWLIADGSLATLFDSGGSPRVHQWHGNATLWLPPECLWWPTDMFVQRPMTDCQRAPAMMAVVSGQLAKLLVCIQQISHQAMRRWFNVGLMAAERCRWWANIKPGLSYHTFHFSLQRQVQNVAHQRWDIEQVFVTMLAKLRRLKQH